MQILPYKIEEINSQKTVDQVRSAIEDNCGSKKNYESYSFFSIDKNPFVGTLTHDGFKVRRNTIFRTAFEPFAFGKIKATNTGVNITILYRSHMLLIIFLCFWSLISLGSAISMIIGDQNDVALLFFGAFLFGYFLLKSGIWFGVPKLHKTIENLVAGHS